MIDVVIPTMLLTDKNIFSYTLEQMKACDVIRKIIIIDNTDDCSFRKTYHSNLGGGKFCVVENGKNVLVNPAWNQGLSLVEAEHYVILNDDVLCHSKIFKICEQKMRDDQDVGILTVDTLQSKNIDFYNNHIKETEHKPPTFTTNIFRNRVGWFMCGRKSQWVPIPDNIKIFYGDDFIYQLARKNKRKVLSLQSQSIVHFESTSVNHTLKKDPKIKETIQKDGHQWAGILRGIKNGGYNKPT